MLVNLNGVETLYYGYADNQGSLIALTDVSGNVVEKYAYDPWGVRRNPNDWTQNDSRTSWITNRGYTGHEHLDAFGIINMNGRVYDPYTAQFFSPDPYVQAPGDWLNYNRYGYCMGNPFKYTDPSGFSWFSRHWKSIITTVAAIGVGIGVGVLTGGMGLVAAGMLGGSAGGFTSGALGTALNGGNFNQCLGAGIQGAVIGAYAGVAGGGAAQWMTGLIGSGVGGFAAGAAIGATGGAAGGFVGGSLGAWMNGASFGDGIMAGLGGAAMGAAAGGLIGGTIKGIDAVANGKANFWDGTTTLDLSTGYGAENVRTAYKTVKGTYVGKFAGVKVFESEELGTYVQSAAFKAGGIALPGRGITVGQGVFSRALDIQLLEHEFGHILQAKDIGLLRFYNEVAPASAISAKNDGINGWVHKTFWTETWANQLSNDLFYHLAIKDGIDYYSWDTSRFPFK